MQREQQQLTVSAQQLDQQREQAQQALVLATQQQEQIVQAQAQHQTLRLQQETLIAEQVLPLDLQLATLREQQQQLERERSEHQLALTTRQQESAKNQQTQQEKQAQQQQLSTWREAHPSYAHYGEHLPLWRERFSQQQDSEQSLTAQRLRLQAQQRQVQECEQSSQQFQQQQAPLQQQLAAAQTSLDQVQQQLASLQQLHPEETLRAALEQFARQRPQRLLLATLLPQWQQLNIRLTRLQQERQTLTQQIQQNSEQLLTLRASWKEKYQHQQDLEKRCELERRIADLEQHRAQLEAGQPCPLCGSENHPAVQQYQALQLSENQQRLDALKRDVEQLKDQGSTCAAQLKQAQQQDERQLQEEAELNRQMQQLEQQWQSATAALALSLSPQQHQQTSDWLAQQDEQETAKQQQLQQLEQALRHCQQQKEALYQHQQAWQALQQQIQLQQQQFTAATQTQSEQQQQLTLDEQRAQQLRIKLAEGVAPLGLTLPQDGDYQRWLQLRETEWQQWRSNSEALAALVPELATLSSRQQALEEELQQQQARLAQLDQRLQQQQETLKHCQQQRQALFGDRDVTTAQQQLRTETEQHAQAVRQAQTAWQQQQDRINTLTGQHKSLNEQLINLQSQLDEMVNQSGHFDDLPAQRILLESQLSELNQQLRELASQQGQLRQQLRDDSERRTQQQTLLAEIAANEQQLEDWSYLNQLIGSKEGDKFRRFAQGLTLDHLVWLANNQLNRLHGRYLLQRKSQEALELQVVDTWQADAQRDTRTLSGGESFLVSLALALALSDLVSHKTRIESLFLDEGFGTLDAETLDSALDALDALNASGKTIGVISHVEAMKERIPVQIKVKKINGLGYSRLETPGQ